MTGVVHIPCFLPQGSKKEGRLALARQLIGNNDEVTDLRFLGPPEAPTHLALATNSPAIRVFDIQTLNCTATLAGHADTVLVMDALYSKGTFPAPVSSQCSRADYSSQRPAGCISHLSLQSPQPGLSYALHMLHHSDLTTRMSIPDFLLQVEAQCWRQGLRTTRSGSGHCRVHAWPSGMGTQAPSARSLFPASPPASLSVEAWTRFSRSAVVCSSHEMQHTMPESDLLLSLKSGKRQAVRSHHQLLHVPRWLEASSSSNSFPDAHCHICWCDTPSMQVWDVSGVAAAAEEGTSSAQPAQLQSTAVVAAHDKDINALAVSPNDALICTASQDRTAKASSCRAPAAALLRACIVAVLRQCFAGLRVFVVCLVLQEHCHHPF